MIVGLEFLSSINEKVIGICGEEKREFASGDEMKSYFSKADGKYAVKSIQIENGMIAVSVKDKSSAIEAENVKFMKSEERKNGIEPSFF